MIDIPQLPPTVLLFCPGDRPDRFGKAAASTADAVVLDLEDSVAPERKGHARDLVAGHGIPDVPVVVRINARKTPWFPDDLAAMEHARIAAVMLPKTEGPDDIDTLHQGIGRFLPVIPLVETAAGIANLARILQATGVVRVAFGALDFSLDVGCTENSAIVEYARYQILLQSRASGRLPPIDGVTTNINDAALIEEEARSAALMGFGGKLAIHPNQITPIRRAFDADPRLVAWAQRVLAASGSGAVRQLEGSMIDAPIIARATRILAKAGMEP